MRKKKKWPIFLYVCREFNFGETNPVHKCAYREKGKCIVTDKKNKRCTERRYKLMKKQPPKPANAEGD